MSIQIVWLYYCTQLSLGKVNRNPRYQFDLTIESFVNKKLFNVH